MDPTPPRKNPAIPSATICAPAKGGRTPHEPREGSPQPTRVSAPRPCCPLGEGGAVQQTNCTWESVQYCKFTFSKASTTVLQGTIMGDWAVYFQCKCVCAVCLRIECLICIMCKFVCYIMQELRVHQCAIMCTNVHQCVICKCAPICTNVQQCAPMCTNVQISNVRCATMCKFAPMCTNVKCAPMCTRGNDYPSPQCDGPGHVTPQIIISCSTAISSRTTITNITIIVIIYQFTFIIFPFTESFRPEMKSKTCCYLLSHCVSAC